MDIDKLLVLIHTRVEAAGSQKALAAELGISLQYLNDVLHQRREPGEKLLKPLGLVKVVSYQSREGKR